MRSIKYGFGRELTMNFEDALAKLPEALKAQGFGVLTEIDVQATLKKKLDVDFRKYRILGACNPAYSYRALQAEDKIGVMLPCNVVVIEQGENNIEIAAVNPAEAMMSVHNGVVSEVASEVGEKLKAALDKL